MGKFIIEFVSDDNETKAYVNARARLTAKKELAKVFYSEADAEKVKNMLPYGEQLKIINI